MIANFCVNTIFQHLIVNCIMKKMVFFLLFSFVAFETSFANDTTSVKIFFGMNDFHLSESEQKILDDVKPNDSSIVLKKISIYGYCDSLEKDDAKHFLSLQRALEVKKYLIGKGIASSLMSNVEGKGKKIIHSSDDPTDKASQVLVIIEYDAIAQEEQPIIIQSTRKKQNDNQ